MNNSVFEKTMENVRNRINVNLVRCIIEENKIRKFIAGPSFAKAKIFDHDLAAIHMHKTKLSILDLSKHVMYEFYYNHLKSKYDGECNLLYTDTSVSFTTGD